MPQLGDELTKAWHAHNEVPAFRLMRTRRSYAQRVIAQRCLYGVDKNPMAADLAKLSLWLATLAKDHPFTFLDHSLRHGDSLVGLTRQANCGIPLGSRRAAEHIGRNDSENALIGSANSVGRFSKPGKNTVRAH